VIGSEKTGFVETLRLPGRPDTPIGPNSNPPDRTVGPALAIAVRPIAFLEAFGRVRTSERAWKRMIITSRLLGGGTATLLYILVGCSSGTPYVEGSLEEAIVKGTVKVRGKPFSEGEIHFSPVNSKRQVAARDAPIAQDGSFTIKTLLGPNTVTVTPPKARAKLRSKEYFGLEYEEKSVDVKSGDNTVDLEFLP
jgi:hypothetical protein